VYVLVGARSEAVRSWPERGPVDVAGMSWWANKLLHGARVGAWVAERETVLTPVMGTPVT
jgi:hypothetical protein